jgi:hypothetical protein
MHGAQAIMMEYNPKENYVTALSFPIILNGRRSCSGCPLIGNPPRNLSTREQAVRF